MKYILIKYEKKKIKLLWRYRYRYANPTPVSLHTSEIHNVLSYSGLKMSKFNADSEFEIKILLCEETVILKAAITRLVKMKQNYVF